MARRHRVRGAGGRFAPRPIKSGFFTDSLTPGIALYGIHMMRNIHQAMREWGAAALDIMQAEAPWEDRTGDARSGLGWSLDEDWVKPTLHLFHGVDYGIWLEVRWSGEYAIIMPTIEDFGPELIQMIEDVI